MVITSTFTVVPTHFVQKTSFALAAVDIGYGCGVFVCPSILEVLDTNYGFSGSVLVVAGIALNMCVCGALYRPARNSMQQKRKNAPSQQTSKPPQAIGTSSIATITDSKAGTGITPIENVEIAISSSETTDRTSKKSEMALPNTETTSDFAEASGGSASSPKPPAHMEPEGPSKSQQGIGKLMRNPIFVLTAVAITCFRFAEGVTSMYIPTLATEQGLVKSETSLVVMVLGISDMAWIMPLGILVSLNAISRYRRCVYCAFLVWMGVGVVGLGFSTGFYQLIIIAAAHAITKESATCQLAAIIIDVLGPENLTMAFGLLIWFGGVGNMMGITITGKKSLCLTFMSCPYMSSCSK